MNINLKLKKRREKINKFKKYEKQKILKKFKKDITENLKDNPDELIKEKIKNYNEIEKKNYFEQKNFELDKNNDYKKNIKEKIKNNDIEKNDIKNFNYLKKKRYNKEEIENLKEKRKIIYKNLHKTNKYGQPIMKYQIVNLLQKIKKKKNEGLI